MVLVFLSSVLSLSSMGGGGLFRTLLWPILFMDSRTELVCIVFRSVFLVSWSKFSGRRAFISSPVQGKGPSHGSARGGVV